MKFKKGDNIVVMSGKDLGKKGKIEKIYPKKDTVVVAGINVYKRHTKPQAKSGGGIIDIIKPINVAKVAFDCPKCKQVSRLGYIFEGMQKMRICKKCKQTL